MPNTIGKYVYRGEETQVVDRCMILLERNAGKKDGARVNDRTGLSELGLTTEKSE